MEQETFPEELADALVGVQRLLRRRLRAGLTVPRLRAWKERRAALVGRHVARLDAADRQALHAALPALRALAVSLHEEAEET